MHRRWALVAVLAVAACTPSASESPGPSEGPPNAAPSAAAELPSGTITIVTGAIADGPGLSVSEALATAGEEGLLVNGTLLKDAEGTIWLCEALSEASPPDCAVARLRVENFPEDAGDLDPANAEVTGLQQDGDVVWLEDHQLYGTVMPTP